MLVDPKMAQSLDFSQGETDVYMTCSYIHACSVRALVCAPYTFYIYVEP